MIVLQKPKKEKLIQKRHRIFLRNRPSVLLKKGTKKKEREQVCNSNGAEVKETEKKKPDENRCAFLPSVTRSMATPSFNQWSECRRIQQQNTHTEREIDIKYRSRYIPNK